MNIYSAQPRSIILAYFRELAYRESDLGTFHPAKDAKIIVGDLDLTITRPFGIKHIPITFQGPIEAVKKYVKEFRMRFLSAGG